MVQNWNLNFCTGLKIHEQKSDGHVEKTHGQMRSDFWIFIATTTTTLPLFKPSVAVTLFSATQWNRGFHLCLPTSRVTVLRMLVC